MNESLHIDGAAAAVRALRGRVDGELVTPGDEDWDAARQAWNLAVDQRPAAVALPESAEDVVEIVRFAREQGLQRGAAGHGPQRLAARPAGGHDPPQDLADARRRDRPRGADRPRRGRGALARGRQGGGRARAGHARRLVAGRGRRRLHARGRLELARPPLRPRCEQRRRRRARHRRRKARPRRRRERARALLGAPRRRRQLRRRHRARVPALPDHGGLRRRPLLPGRARVRGPARLARVDPRRAGRDDVGRAAAPDAADPGRPGAAPRPLLRDRRAGCTSTSPTRRRRGSASSGSPPTTACAR